MTAIFGAAQTSLAAQAIPDPYDMGKAVAYTASSNAIQVTVPQGWTLPPADASTFIFTLGTEKPAQATITIGFSDAATYYEQAADPSGKAKTPTEALQGVHGGFLIALVQSIGEVHSGKLGQLDAAIRIDFLRGVAEDVEQLSQSTWYVAEIENGKRIIHAQVLQLDAADSRLQTTTQAMLDTLLLNPPAALTTAALTPTVRPPTARPTRQPPTATPTPDVPALTVRRPKNQAEAETVKNLWGDLKLADPREPETNTYSVRIPAQQTYAFASGWCAKTQSLLRQNLSHRTGSILVNGAAVAQEQIFHYEKKIDATHFCAFDVIVITGWQSGESYIIQSYIDQDAEINDGTGNYAAGVYEDILIVEVT